MDKHRADLENDLAGTPSFLSKKVYGAFEFDWL